MTETIHYFTPQGYEHAQQELETLKTVTRKEIARRIEAAKELGDLRENAEYHEAREEMAFLEGRIHDLEHRINHAVIVEEMHGGSISVGTTFTAKTESHETKTYTIVGESEADPAAGKISSTSPLGKAFLHRRSGDRVEVITPKGPKMYTVESVR